MKDLSLLFLITFVTIPVKTDDPLCVGFPHDEEVVFASPLDCSQYYKCFNGIFSVEECSDGLLFSDNNKGCVLPEYAECAGGSGSPTESTMTDSTTTTPTPTPTRPPTHEGSHTPFPTSQSTSTASTTLGTTTKTTPTPVTETTTEKTSSSTTEATSTSTPVTEITTGTTPDDVDPRCTDGNTSFWPHPRDCNKYIECYQGDSYEMACPTDTYYSDKHKKCTDADESECCKNNSSQCKYYIKKKQETKI